ncbi:MAG TPA: YceI family protein, partial [Candidatus Binatia bacterium]
MQKDSMRRLICFRLFALLLLAHAQWARADVQRFRLNPDTSEISATIDDPFGNRVKGTLRLTQGEARGDPDRLAETAAVSLAIQASSYNSNVGLRDQDVQEHYLEVKQYPLIRFDSTGVVKSERSRSSAAPWLITLKGELELHGVRKEILVPIQLFYQANKIIAQGQFPLLLEEFSLAVPRLLFLKTGNNVQVEFRIGGERQP